MNIKYGNLIWKSSAGILFCFLKYDLTPNTILNLQRLDLHFNNDYHFMFSVIRWSHWKLSSHSSWVIILPFSVNGDSSPKGSYTNLSMTNNPPLVKVLSITFMLKSNISLSVFFNTPRAFSSGICPVKRSWSFIPTFLSCSGIAVNDPDDCW